MPGPAMAEPIHAHAGLERVRLEAARLPAAAQWADGLIASVPLDWAPLVRAGRCDELGHDRNAAHELRERRAFLDAPPAPARLPVSYRTVPGGLRRLLAHGMGRVQRRRQKSWAAFPGWPVDLSADVLADLTGAPTIRIPSPTPVLLTHDIDSPEGLQNLVRWLLPLEEAAGARSANYIVPFAWPLDTALIDDALHRGHEIGVHGYDHSGTTPFLPPLERQERLARGAAFGAEYHAVGYRAPSLMRSRQLLSDLQAHYAYDSSIPTSGGPFPTANNGCASARPWRIGSIWELPLSLPRDGSLRFLGYAPQEIAAMWIDAAHLVARSGGIVVLLTHCEAGFSGNPAMLDAYRQFIEAVASDKRFVFQRPRDLAARLAADALR